MKHLSGLGKAAVAALIVSLATGAQAHRSSHPSGTKKSTAKAPPSARLKVTGVRYWSSPEVTRLVIDLSRSADFSYDFSSDSSKVFVHVEGAVLAPDVQGVTVSDSAVEKVALRSVTGGGVTAEIGLTRPTPVRVFALSPVPGRPNRVVLDVTRYISPVQEAAEVRQVEEVVQSRERVVVVDPGHGGDAPGAEGVGGIYEKDVTLAVGLKLAEKLNATPGIKAILTRDRDYDLPLRRRFQMAEKYKADLFVSIHCNASRDHEAHGTEVYFVSLNAASDEASKELADQENSADALSGQLPDVNDNVKNILFDLRQNDTVKKSSDLADLVLESLSSRDDLEFRGVKQAGFAVLKSPMVPSILVETAFITNRQEARLLTNPEFQDSMAGLIARGLQSYLERYPGARRTVRPASGPGGGGGASGAGLH